MITDCDARVERNGQTLPRLEEWCVVGSCLMGFVFGHSDFKDGHWIKTSRLLGVEGGEIRTRNSRYKLGEPHPSYLLILNIKRLTPQDALRLVALSNSVRGQASHNIG